MATSQNYRDQDIDKITYVTLRLNDGQEIQEDRVTSVSRSTNPRNEEDTMPTMYGMIVIWPVSTTMITGDVKASREEAMSGLRDAIDRHMGQWIQQA